MEQSRRFKLSDILYIFPIFFGMLMLAAVCLPFFLFAMFLSSALPSKLMLLPFVWLPSLWVWYRVRTQNHAKDYRLRWSLIGAIPLVGPVLFAAMGNKPRFKVVHNLDNQG